MTTLTTETDQMTVNSHRICKQASHKHGTNILNEDGVGREGTKSICCRLLSASSAPHFSSIPAKLT